jgi:3-methyladenine DNA glycosylase AlkD
MPREIYKALYKQLKKPIKAMPFEERLVLAGKLVSSRMNEQAGFANLVLSLSIDQLTPHHFDYLGEHVGCFCSWGATDSFCIDVLQPLLLKFPEDVLALLGMWNQADNPWLRRASVVAFTRKIGASGIYTRQALALCENLIADKEYYVLKGVGWALKDVMRGDKAMVLDYVRDLRRRGVSSIITLYAIKDLVGEEREEILTIKARKGD